MKPTNERTAAEWFLGAMECYVVNHQGCPSCRRQHCVFRSSWGNRIEYYCSACEFSTCRDGATGQCQFTAGDKEHATVFVLDAVS